MFSYAERMAAVELYIARGCNHGAVMRELGYPSPVALRKWYKEFVETGDLKKVSTQKPRFTQAQINAAVEHYFAHGQSYVGTSRALGYPNRMLLKKWILASGRQISQPCKPSNSVVKYTDKEKQEALLLWASGWPDYKVAAQYGVCAATIYQWRKKFLGEGANMKRKCNRKTPPPKVATTTTEPGVNLPLEVMKDERKSLKADVAELHAEKAKLQKELDKLRFEKDIIEATMQVLKKGQDINLTSLKNREKAEVIDVLRVEYRLNNLLKSFKISKSSYFYIRFIQSKEDKYADLRIQIQSLFEENHRCYGYRRIHALLKKAGTVVSEKVVRRLMTEQNLLVYVPKKKKRFSSYVGEIDEAPENLVKRNFHADGPNQLWLTDISEFAIPAGKVYLSPILDCFDGQITSWTRGCHPTAELANSMLTDAVTNLPEGAHPIIHSDRGGHYRWPKWVEITERAGLTRSMSRKGCSQDNSACESFFGRLKNEMFYGRSWAGVSLEDFMHQLDEYIHWYNHHRIKLSLDAMSPVEYRQSLGLI